MKDNPSKLINVIPINSVPIIPKIHPVVAVPTNFLPLNTELYDIISSMPAIICKISAINKNTNMGFKPPQPQKSLEAVR